ncbi:hypothetical protein LPJ61_004870 [Coemansia biformis]|uniref:Uncharacterized protein n=1 Tax=Coemansia biformis TaxID=1286918 RepID=A0A9W7Y424_9FUNG|nr:hypothetical protein LPJ61_004870 [Coemansia biformis]
MDCSDDNDDDTDELLITPHAPSADANSAAATATRPQNDQQQQQGLQYEQPAQAEPERQMSTPPQQRRRARNTSARSPTMPNTSSPLAASASFSGQVPPPSDIVARRPLTPHIASAVFVTDPEVHPTSPTVRRHRHNRSYQNHDCAQPLTPTHSSTSLVTFAAANAEADDQHSASSPVQLASSSMLLPRPAMRLHAASISSAGGSQLRRGSSSDSSGSGPSTTGTGAAEQPPQQTHEQQEPPPQQLEYRARTPSESELGQFDGPPSTHLALPLPSESPSNASTLCSRTSAAPYDVLGIVMADSEHHVAEPSA